VREERDRIPSRGCLLYLVADKVVPQVGVLGVKVPCRRVWVHGWRLNATMLAASYLSLRDSGHLTLVSEQSSDTKRWRQQPRTVTGVTARVAKSTPPPGLPGMVLKLAKASSRVASIPGNLQDYLKDPENGYQYLSLVEAAKGELLHLGYAQFSLMTFAHLECTRLAALSGACADAVRWWERLQADEAALFTALVDSCLAACDERGGGG
jgi:hypothetical protein